MLSGVVLIVLAILAIVYIGRFFSPTGPEISEYNNWKFYQQDKTWHFNWQGQNLYDVQLRNHPTAVEKIPLIGKLNDTFNDREEIYVTIDPRQKDQMKWLSLAKAELIWSLIGPFNKKIIDACTVNTTECEGFPIVNCATPNASVIMLAADGPSMIYSQDECILLTGKENDLVKSVDKLLYKWYGVII